MNKNLIFSSVKQAIQYLANFENCRVIVAKSLKDAMPQLKDRIKRKSHKFKDDNEIEEIILNLAKMDPKFKGNLDQSVKPIHVFVDWFIENPEGMKPERAGLISDYYKKFNTLRGQGITNKRLRDFEDVSEMLTYVDDLEEEVEKKEAKDRKKQFLANPEAVSGNIKAYYIDKHTSWDELGQALFSDQTKWCVNNESNYDAYIPLWLFTKDNHYFALFSPGEKMFNNDKNRELDKSEVDELFPLLEKLNLVDDFEASNSGEFLREPPYDEQYDYEVSAWDSWIKNDYIKALSKKFEDNTEKYLDQDNDAEIDDIPEDKLFDIFKETAMNNEVDWEWEQDYDGSYSMNINYQKVVDNTKWTDIYPYLLDEFERKIYRGEDVNLEELKQHHDIEKMRKKYPKYFKNIAEKHGQMKLFSSTNEALQYLADFTGKKISIKK